jgi:TolB-like protein/DNA-binding winged helix-turn-helix (wHTH) protein/rhodanese-related sulfurtransferase
MLLEIADYRFDRFRLDTRRWEFWANGKRVPLDTKACQLLACLIRHQDRPLTRDEILAQVWPGVIVAPASVAVQIHAIRRAIAGAGCPENLILTLKQPVSYRFVGTLASNGAPANEARPGEPAPITPPAEIRPLEIIPQEQAVPEAPPAFVAPGDAQNRVKIGRTAALLVPAALLAAFVLAKAWFAGAPPAPPLSIAVLPFHNESPDDRQASLADAITDDLIEDLTHIPGSIVSSRGSAAAVQGRTAQQIGRALNTRYIVDGSVRAADKDYHATARLIEAATGQTRWSATIDRPSDRESDLRQDIVGQIASQLHLSLDEIESSRAEQDRPSDPSDLDLFFEARHILDQDTTLRSFQAAQALLERAVQQKPDFADAQAKLGWMLLAKVEATDDPDDMQDLAAAQRHIDAALAISAQNTTALAARARLLEIDGKCDEASAIAGRVVAMEHSNLDARSVLARCDQFALRLEDAATQYGAMLRLDPFSPASKLRHLALGTILLLQSQYPEAVDQLGQCLDDAAPGTALEPGEQCRLLLLAAHGLNGQVLRAQQEYQLYQKQFPGRTVWRVAAYFPSAWRSLPGFKAFRQSLQAAGMPEYADEAGAGLAPGADCPAGDFHPTPNAFAPGTPGTVIATQAFAARAADPATLVIDVGRATAANPAWAIYMKADLGLSPAEYALQAASQPPGANKHRPIVVLADGSTGCSAYNAALALIAAGYTHVAWYRGGEDAWSRTPHPVAQLP